MNPSSDIGHGSATIPPGLRGTGPEPAPANWRQALMALIASRIELVQLESKEAAQGVVKMAVCIIAAAICLVFTWALLIAGGISLVAKAGNWPWNWVAIVAAILHLIAAIILARLAKPSGKTAFPVTRAEFQKDREWIENFQQPKKSSD